jgi:glycosyltransferase involved in cell wall biosynthesis
MNKEIKPTLVFMSPIATRSGYGDDSYDKGRSLLRYDKYDVKFVSTKWGNCPMNQLQSPRDDDILSRILNSSLSQAPEIHIQNTIPNEFQPIGKFNIGCTAGIETALCRAEWIEGINRMNLIIVPSEHAKKVFETTTFVKTDQGGKQEKGKCRVPIEVLFEGADTSIFKKTKDIPQSIRDTVNKIPEDFVFLFVGHWLQGEMGHDRKDVGMLIKTFLEIFKNKKKKPALLLKTSGATLSEIDRTDIQKKIEYIKSTVQGDLPNVYLLHGDLSREEINGLYNHPKVKAHVNFTHGEGYGRPLLEASLSGKPLITTNWSGHIDFLNPAYAILLPGEVKPVHPSSVNDWIIKESSWFFANYSIAGQKMEDVYENYGNYTENAEKLRVENERKFSISAMDTKFLQILDKYVPKFEKQVEINLPSLKKFQSPEITLPKPQNDIELPKLQKIG